jgi:hypothetical protein
MTSVHEAEIVGLHDFFEGWLGGTLPDTDDAFERFERTIGEAFTFIDPDGRFLERAELVAHLRAAHGARPGLRIRIENPRIRHETCGLTIATYEEWQEAGDKTTGRLSSAVFRDRGEGVEWVHVHETWLRGRTPYSTTTM